MNEYIEKLKSLDFSKSTSKDVREILVHLPISYMSYTIQPGILVSRARKGKGYKTAEETTYCPVEYCKQMQRATLANDTMFYGVVSDDQSHLENARAICVSECSSLCREGLESVGKEYFCISQWEIVQPIRVVSFVADDTFSKVSDNSLLNQMRNSFVLAHKNDYSRENTEVARLISSEFSKVVADSSEYLVSATIANDIIHELKYDGIVYPSVQLGGQAGLNVALAPIAADSKLKFCRVLEHGFYKKGTKSILRIERTSFAGSPFQTVNDDVSDAFICQDLGISNISQLPEC